MVTKDHENHYKFTSFLSLFNIIMKHNLQKKEDLFLVRTISSKRLETLTWVKSVTFF